MKAKTTLSFVLSLALLSTGGIIASADTELTLSGNVNKFDIGSEEVGGSGVEDGSCWIKVVQSSNPKLKLFEDVGPDVNVTALTVTFEISEWSGTEFPVTWGANIDFIGDDTTTWCGTSAFEGISDYTINGNGEYTFVCDLAALCDSMGKEGIAHMQTCEMVIKNVEENDPTVIEVKSASIAFKEAEEEGDDSQPEDSSSDSQAADSLASEKPADTTDKTDSSAADTAKTADTSAADTKTESTANSESTDKSEATTQKSEEKSTSADSTTTQTAAGTASTASSNTTSAASTAAKTTSANTAAASDSTEPVNNDNVPTGACEDLALAMIAVSSAAMILSKKRR